MKINNSDELKLAIQLLEEKQITEYHLLRAQFEITLTELKPINLLKSTIKGFVGDNGLKNTVVNSTLGVITGAISKKVFIGTSHNPIKNVIGTLLQIGVAGIVAKNGDEIKTGIMRLFGRFLKKD